jgi:hypothetical protein
MVREGVITHLYLGVGGLYVVGFERRAAYKTSIGDNPQAPNIYFVGVSVVGMV